ncbi:MAG: flagellar motor switch protein FliG [Planctomycetota bacterium]|nr:flagellar motor switch protein FliG [Planctomycetota bacterium]MDA0920140.1 flagellar motor switch protein FliG [Planctomycetota bacterium]MDA1158583.1 flagellar motor switch protein FliG [Planctomycetota bacterium]
MNDLKRAAIVLLSLDKPKAARVMNHLPKDLMELVSLEIARTDDVTKAEQEEAINTFREAVDSRTVIERGSLDLAGELLSQSIGEEEANEIIKNIRDSLKSVPFGFLHKFKAEDVLNFISEEQPQTIALIMSNLPTGLAADILKDLPPDKQLDVIRRVASMEQTSPEFVEMVEASLKNRMVSLFGQQSDQVGGVPLVAQILNVADRATSKNILDTMGQESEELVEEIQRLMFVFDDITKLDDKSIQALLKEVDNSQWAMALKGASPEVKGKILGNLSKRAAENLEEEMGYLGPVRVSDVESVQQQIVDTVRRLEEAGTITVSTGDGDQFVS